MKLIPFAFVENINDTFIENNGKELMTKLFSNIILTNEQFYLFIKLMFVVGIFVFIMLFFVQAGYGKFQKSSVLWSFFLLPNKIAWVLMECPVFFVMMLFYLNAKFNLFSNTQNMNNIKEERQVNIGTLVCFILFQFHYFQRSFIFPCLMKGKSKMPIVIMLMGALFNTCNGILQGNWLFNISSQNYYDDLFKRKSFYFGLLIFFSGMFINIHSDHVIRNLRKPGDTKHYLPQKGLYRYITSANYFGEIVEWIGYSILSRSLSGILFVFWSIANLVPRSFSIYNLYINEFGDEVLKKKRIIPFLL